MKIMNLVKRFTRSEVITPAIEQQIPVKISDTVMYNPLFSIHSEEFSDANIEEREAYLKSHCREAETVIATLAKMFPGEISSLYIEELDLNVPCILKISRELTTQEHSHILSISRHIQFM
jgi:hypothetical protein